MNRKLVAPKRIVIHASDTKDSGTLSWGVLTTNAIVAGYDYNPYHAGVELVRGRFECLYGRPDYFEGAHCRGGGQNHEALGFCFVGKYDLVCPPGSMLVVAASRVLVPWMITYDLTPADLVPHSDYSHKTCPGLMFDMDTLRMVADEIKGETQS